MLYLRLKNTATTNPHLASTRLWLLLLLLRQVQHDCWCVHDRKDPKVDCQAVQECWQQRLALQQQQQCCQQHDSDQAVAAAPCADGGRERVVQPQQHAPQAAALRRALQPPQPPQLPRDDDVGCRKQHLQAEAGAAEAASTRVWWLLRFQEGSRRGWWEKTPCSNLSAPASARLGDAAIAACLAVSWDYTKRSSAHLAPHWCHPYVGQQDVRQQRAVAVRAAQEGGLPLGHVARGICEHTVVNVCRHTRGP